MQILLDGKNYEVSSPVVRELIQEWPSQLKTTGDRRRGDRSALSIYAKPSWEGGLGIKRQIIDEDVSRLWDSDSETRFPGQITPPILPVTDSITPVTNLMGLSVYRGELYAIGAGTYATQTPLFKYSVASGYTVDSNSAQGTISRCLGLISSEGPGGDLWQALWGITSVGSLADCRFQRIKNSPTIYSGFAHIANLYSAGAPQGARLGVVYQPESPLVVLTVVDTNGKLDSTSLPTAKLTASSSIVATPSLLGANSINGIIEITNLYGSIYPAVGLPRQVRQYHKTQSQVIMDLENYNLDNSAGLSWWNRVVIVPMANGDVYAVREDGTTLEIGPMSDEGLPSDMAGPYTAGLPTNRWLFLAKGGNGTNRRASILAWDKIGWHRVWKDTVGDRVVTEMALSNLDGITRMHFLLGPTYGIGGATLAFHLPFILSNPLMEASLSVATQGQFTDSEFDGFTPEMLGGFYRLGVRGLGLGVLNTVTPLYGFDGATSAATLGIATQNDSILRFSSVGTQARVIQLKYLLTRGTLSATYPRFVEGILEYIKQPPVREQFTFNIDLEKTSKITRRSQEEIIGEIGSLSNLVSLVPMQYGQIPTKSVKVEVVQSSDIIEGIHMKLSSVRSGMITVKLLEI